MEVNGEGGKLDCIPLWTGGGAGLSYRSIVDGFVGQVSEDLVATLAVASHVSSNLFRHCFLTSSPTWFCQDALRAAMHV